MAPGTVSTGVGRLLAEPWRIFVLALALMFVNMAAWSLATPPFASPDEPAHVERAVALERGQVIGRTLGSAGNPITAIRIPQLYAHGAQWADCFALQMVDNASCAGPLTGSSKVISSTTYVGRYPPLYYAIVGLPSLFAVSSTGIYLMRLMSDLLSSVYLALAVLSIARWSKSRFMLVGLLLAVTPMTFFLGSTVNPSGLEITSAICLWCSGLVLALERPSRPPPGLVAVFAASLSTLMLARGLSPLWVALILALLALLAGWHNVVDVVRARAARWSLVLVVPCAVFALGWIVIARSLDLLPVGVRVGRKETGAHLAATIFGNTGTWIQQMIGIFGWLNTLSPLITYLVWYVGVGLVLVLALSCVRGRHVVVLLLLIGIVLFVPVVISYGQAHRLGVIWQARYIMPMAVGIPLVSAALLARTDVLLQRASARVATLLCILIGVGQLFAFAEALRRFTVGVLGPIDFLHGPWQPPFGATALLGVALLGTVALMAFARALIALDPGDPIHPPPLMEPALSEAP
jgi:Predicted membrane protein (DUF2142)